MSPQSYSKFSIFLLLLLVSFSSWQVSARYGNEGFLDCLYSESPNISSVVYTPKNSSYSSVLQSTLRNERFNTTFTPKPYVIVTPLEVYHVQSTIVCSREHGMQIRIRSGGHDYEGLSYVSVLPFVILDLVNFQDVTVDTINNTAWVQGGATLGKVYYGIAEKSRTLGFPGGGCPTVGIGGYISGGGYGTLLRKYGLAADNVIDAHLVDVNGRVLDRASMGEDLFWAIRGGGGNSFGVVIAWKLNLVPVPPTVTVFTVQRTLEQNATELVHRWQYVADKLDKDLFIRIFLTRANATFLIRGGSSTADQEGSTAFVAGFDSLFLGGIDRLLPLMRESFPELGLLEEDCIEMSWIQSILYFAGQPINSSLEVLLDRTQLDQENVKVKSDYVKKPIPETGLEGIWERFHELDGDLADNFIVLFTPYGGRMSEISESSTPFPHRAGNIFKILYSINWSEEGLEESRRHINWIRRLYSYMTPYVSSNPREAYINYRDLDIGMNNLDNHTSYTQASIWGTKYFKNNFDRLVHVKTDVDPSNFFRNEQSIPPLSSW